ncbi:hypothetical protein C2U70_03010 [Bradyrhizobium guangdongense]|uniref:hypothetical protein n=1 Tax=Bradyrhizobium guangdongense TaxID=1325090 RepID=UPI001126A7B6|nr:hypothetical protein [Bradyrhizobium guangdongense]TPQ41295.1 hypothetical protein C2U70_03010 [Bradyrhizobium guangdongense]
MKIVLLTIAMLGGQLVTPISDRVPKLNVEATCKASVAADKAMGLVLAQSYEDCMRDENAAQQQILPIWTANSDKVRNECEGEATVAGTESYVDLLTCLQMASLDKPSAPALALRGASKNRNRK